MRVKIPKEDKTCFFWWYLYLFHPPRSIYEEATQGLDWWESSTELLAGLLWRLRCCSPAQAVISWCRMKAALCMNGGSRWLNIKEEMTPQFFLVFTVSLLWIHLWCGHVWVICWFCHTGSMWNSSLEFSVMTVSFWTAHAGHAHMPLLCRTQHETAQIWLYCQMLLSLLSLHLLILSLSYTAQALKH